MTFEDAADAFKAIETGKNDAQLQMYDIGFGGRRAFCGASYADLGELNDNFDQSNNENKSLVVNYINNKYLTFVYF